jgi:hypothetical protein
LEQAVLKCALRTHSTIGRQGRGAHETPLPILLSIRTCGCLAYSLPTVGELEPRVSSGWL